MCMYFLLSLSGVPKLKRLELEAACEDFSNIIGYFLNGTVYKGTLSSGVEIAVTSFTVKSIKEWSKYLEAQFKKKVFELKFSKILCVRVPKCHFFFHASDRHVIKNEPQKFCQPHWILWRKWAFHKNDGFWICSKWNYFRTSAQWVSYFSFNPHFYEYFLKLSWKKELKN